MKNIISFICSLFVFALSTIAQAAPIPGTASSKLVSPQLGLYRSPQGFQVAAGGSGWKLSEPPKGMKHVAAIYRAGGTPSVAAQMKSDLRSGKNIVASNGASSGALTVRVDALKKDVTLERYVARWMKEYPRYGFDVLGSKPFVQNNQTGMVLDLVNRAQSKQLRQVVFLKNQRAVILTCRDGQKTFADTLKSCNQIIRTFAWQ